MQIKRLQYPSTTSEDLVRNKTQIEDKSFKSLLSQTRLEQLRLEETGSKQNSMPALSEIPDESLRFSASSTTAQENNIAQNHSLLYIGQVTKDTPTVSELIFQTSHKKNCWNILGNSVNADKPFRTIRPGTDIYMDSKTSEIIWGDAAEKINGTDKAFAALNGHSTNENSSALEAPARITNQPSSMPYNIHDVSPPQSKDKDILKTSPYGDFQIKGLDSAVSQFIGRDYDKMDCYELVVGGLRNMGFKYRGQDGLGHHLIDQAAKGGLPYNHYLNGEGLVNAAGHDVFNKTITNIKSIDNQTVKTMNEMEKVLQEGQILSFSTRTSGHTGVISRKDGTWTYINSGTMDNNITGRNGTRAVGEETLENEVKNWIKRAGSKGEGLKISLGSLDISKLSMFVKDKGRVLERA